MSAQSIFTRALGICVVSTAVGILAGMAGGWWWTVVWAGSFPINVVSAFVAFQAHRLMEHEAANPSPEGEA